MIPKPVIAGIAILGGAIVLIVNALSEDKEGDETSKEEENREVFNVEEVRRLRRQLKKQMRLKKKSNSEKQTP